MIRLFFISLSFFTRIPIKIKGEVSEKEFFKSMLLMPFVGLVVGLLLYGFGWVVAHINYQPVESVLTLTFYILLTGGLHLDGVADTGDAIFSARNREKMMEIMKDSRLGTYGAVALALLILGLHVGLVYIFETKSLVTLIIAPIIGRYAPLLLAALSKPAQGGGGLGKGFIDVVKPWIPIVYFIVITIGLILYKQLVYMISFIAVNIFVLLEVVYFKSKLGGITGDQNGLTIELSQVVFVYCCIICSSFLR